MRRLIARRSVHLFVVLVTACTEPGPRFQPEELVLSGTYRLSSCTTTSCVYGTASNTFYKDSAVIVFRADSTYTWTEWLTHVMTSCTPSPCHEVGRGKPTNTWEGTYTIRESHITYTAPLGKTDSFATVPAPPAQSANRNWVGPDSIQADYWPAMNVNQAMWLKRVPN
jgi:hypothetical protein